MLSAKFPASGTNGVRAALRLATDKVHQRMHGLEPFARIAAGTLPMGDYRLLLRSLFDFHSSVRDGTRRSEYSLFSSATNRLNMLRADLVFLGCTVPSRPPAFMIEPGEAVLGALYAAEGSMLGGPFVARQLDYAFGSRPEGRRFFIGNKEDRSSWPILTARLEVMCDSQSKLNAAISGAIRTFEWFEKCVATRADHSITRVYGHS